MPFSLEHKVALITGAGSGIGRATALLFGQQGASVLVADKNESAAAAVVREITDQGGTAQPLALDVTDETQVEAAFAHISQTYSQLNILVNNAGISHVGTILETTLADWERVFSVNATGVFLCAKYAVKQMLAQQPLGGTIINIASTAGLIGIPQRLPYCASKGAVISLTRSIAIDFAQQHIRANAICPGTVHTPFVDGYLERHFADRKEAMIQQLNARQPVGRMGKPEEIASAALYLASDEAEFVTGSTLVIDGGWTAG